MTGSIYFDRALKSNGIHKFKKIILDLDTQNFVFV